MNVTSVCPYCGVGCLLQLRVRDGKVIGILPHPRGPGEGHLCIKGWSAHEFIHHNERLRKPLIRDGLGFREAKWEEALDLVASKIREAKAKNGPGSIAVLASAKATNEENYLIQKLTRAAIGCNNIDHCARLCHSSTVTGLGRAFGSGAMTNSQEDLEEADAFLIIGSNTSEQHPLLARRVIKAVKRGANLVVADPRAIPLTEYAALHLVHRPGTDIALLNAMMYTIIDEGLQDNEFIKTRTENYEALKENVSKYTPAYAETITGVSDDKIKEAARIYGSAKRGAILFSMGITQHITGVNNVLSTANLAMLTGNIGRPGTGVNPLRGQNNVQGACDVGALPDLLPGYQRVADPETRRRLSEVWGVEVPSEPGLTLTEKINGAGDKVKVMLIFGENPLMSDPDSNHVRTQMDKLEFLIVSELFMSETAKIADVVLPAASYAEKDGTFTATDRRIQRLHKALEPIGDAKPDWWIVSQLSTRLGYPMNYTNPSEIMDEIAKVTPIYGGVSYKRLEDDGLRWPVPTAQHPGTPILHTMSFSRGLGRFHVVEHRPPAEEPDAEYPLILTTGRVLFHWHTGTMTRRSKTLTDQINEAFIEINDKDAENLGINDNQMVTAASRRGLIRIRARVTNRIMEGVVFIPFHFAEAQANVLTNNAVDAESKIPEYKACAVRVTLN
ncbi:MAG: formate dehydrogenase subunit alpha [Candidatus Bathyarchaeota archaeon]|nr:formate dehydrogenase subunit alpha [Candidatus Bathyarchaeota archaeon]